MDDLVTINRPIQEVFAFVTDHSNDRLWKPFVTEGRQITTGSIGVGTLFEVAIVTWNRRIAGQVEVLEYEPCHWYVYKSNSEPFPFIARLSFAPVASGTVIRGNVDFQAQAAWKWSTPILLIFLRRQSKHTFARLKKAMESAGDMTVSDV